MLVLGVVLAVFQQWCGINVIFNYAEEIFRAAGYDISDVLKNIAWTGSVNLVFTFVALGSGGPRRPPAADALRRGRAGRRFMRRWAPVMPPHVQGLPMLLLVLAAIGCYAMSLAPVTWVVISEIFPNRIRGAAMAVAVASLWLACFLLTYTFPLLERAARPGRHLLAVRRHLRGRLCLHLLPIARDERQNAWKRSSKTVRCRRRGNRIERRCPGASQNARRESDGRTNGSWQLWLLATSVY